jgi:hypothetical protein
MAGRPLTYTFANLKNAKFEMLPEEPLDARKVNNPPPLILDWQEALELKGRDGYSKVGLYTSIRLTQRIHERLYDSEEEYKDWFDYATDLSKSYWLDIMGRKIFKDRNLNSTIYAIQVRNRYGWRQQDDVKPAAKDETPETPVDDLASKHKKKGSITPISAAKN